MPSLDIYENFHSPQFSFQKKIARRFCKTANFVLAEQGICKNVMRKTPFP